MILNLRAPESSNGRFSKRSANLSLIAGCLASHSPRRGIHIARYALDDNSGVPDEASQTVPLPSQ
jgi:hypothetical protein